MISDRAYSLVKELFDRWLEYKEVIDKTALFKKHAHGDTSPSALHRFDQVFGHFARQAAKKTAERVACASHPDGWCAEYSACNQCIYTNDLVKMHEDAHKTGAYDFASKWGRRCDLIGTDIYELHSILAKLNYTVSW